MSATYTPTTTGGAIPGAQAGALRPSFIGLTRGELFKMWNQWTTRIMLGLVLLFTFAPYVLILTSSNFKDTISSNPVNTTYNLLEVAMTIFRVFGGVALLVITARAIGLEYQQGTIRILLARGVGRVQLLSAKLTAVAIVALGMIVGSVILNTILLVFDYSVVYGQGSAFSTLTSDFWAHIWAYATTVLISMVATILLAACVTVIGRSLSFGLTAAMSWFPADNFAVLVLFLVGRLTKSDFWDKLPAYFLGPILNQLPSAYVPSLLITVTQGPITAKVPVPANTVGLTPFVVYDSTHALVITAIYCVVFAAVTFYLTWRRDVLE